jgi:hypothetical protein
LSSVCDIEVSWWPRHPPFCTESPWALTQTKTLPSPAALQLILYRPVSRRFRKRHPQNAAMLPFQMIA